MRRFIAIHLVELVYLARVLGDLLIETLAFVVLCASTAGLVACLF